MRSIHQNRLDRFSAIAKQLVDSHSEAYFKECKEQKSTDQYDAFNEHFDTLGEQLESKANEFLKECKAVSDDLKQDIWSSCSKYLDLFTNWNNPSKLNQYL